MSEFNIPDYKSYQSELTVTGNALNNAVKWTGGLFFFEESDWIPVPPSWSSNIVSFKTYSTDDGEGLVLWEAVNNRLTRSPFPGLADAAA